MGALYSRWQDEKEYEDFADYSKVLEDTFNKLADASYEMKFIKATKSPFGFQFILDGCKVQLSISFKAYSWKVLIMAPESAIAPLLHTLTIPETIVDEKPIEPIATPTPSDSIIPIEQLAVEEAFNEAILPTLGVKEKLRHMLIAAAASPETDGLYIPNLCTDLGIDKKRLSDYICYLGNAKYAGSKGAIKITKMGDYYYYDGIKK